MSSSSPARKPNVRDVARHARVSVATVSRVLNGAQNVAAPTRARVEQAIAALRFVPSSAARAINSGRTRLVGALIPTLDHAIFARFIDALEDGFDSYGLSVIVATTGGLADRERDRAQKLLDLGVEGLVVSGISRGADFEALIDRYQIPVVATSYFDPGYVYPTIGYDNAEVARTALDHLRALGHHKITVLYGPPDINDRTRTRFESIQDAVPYKFQTELSFGAGADAVPQILDRHPDTTAIICLSDVLAQGALTRLRAMGVDVPGRISVIGMDDLPSSQSFDPPLSTVWLPVNDMGRAASGALARWIEAGQRPEHYKLATVLAARQSTGPV